MNENMQFPIPNSVLEPYIKQAISAAIVGSLGDGVKLVEDAVQNALAIKVNTEGSVSQYSSDNKFLLIEVLARKKITEIARDVINELAEQMRPKIKEEIEKQLKTKHKLIAQTLVTGMIESLTSKWAVTIKMSEGN